VRLAPTQAMAEGAAVVSEAISSLRFEDERATTYNIEVEGLHDYFAGGVLVHNKQETCPD
jgi:intein/homing endonuclease